MRILSESYNNSHIEVGCLPNDIEALNESRKNDLFSALTAKSKLYKAHAAELDVFVEAKFETMNGYN